MGSSGLIEWQKCYGGSLDEGVESVIQTSDGGYFISGWTHSNDGDVSGNHGQSDYWLVKLDTSGNLLWQKCYGGSNTDRGDEIFQSPLTGRFMMVGTSWSVNGDLTGNFGKNDLWVIETDQAGNLIWEKNFGGSGNDNGHSLNLSSIGDVTVSGSTNSADNDVIGQHGMYDMWVFQYSSVIPPHVNSVFPSSGQAGTEV